MKALNVEGLTIDEIAPLIRKKQISPLELTKRYLDRIKTLNPTLNAYLAITEENALAAARNPNGKSVREITADHCTAFRYPSRTISPSEA